MNVRQSTHTIVQKGDIKHLTKSEREALAERIKSRHRSLHIYASNGEICIHGVFAKGDLDGIKKTAINEVDKTNQALTAAA